MRHYLFFNISPPVHGWVFGHPHAPELDADFGDFASLVEHMQANAAAAGEEFFLFDSGDLIEVPHDTTRTAGTHDS